MSKTIISIIIPTFNRKDILRKTLQSIDRQKDIELADTEVIVVDDGSTDGTGNMLEQEKDHFSFHLICLRQENKGQGNARNYGIQQAQGFIVFFIGDDIILHSLFLSEHLKVHKKYHEENVACLGFTTWHPDIRVTPFMYFLEHGGHQFNYPKLKKQPIADWELGLRNASYWFFYTSNISLKRSFLAGMKFEPIYTSYGWEDIELGYRLSRDKKMKILYNERAIGYHFHTISEDSFRERMLSVSTNALIFHKRFPEVPVLPTGIKKIVFQCMASQFVLFLLKKISDIIPSLQRWYFYALSKKYFLEGTKES